MYNQFLDDRNRHWWDEINQHFKTSVKQYDGKEYTSRLYEKRAEFFVPANHISKESFTHELLHIWLRAKNIFITEFMLKRLREEPLLYWSFSDNLFEQLGGCLEHVKMLPLFINAGFEKEKFTDDYEQARCRPLHLQIIESGMSKPSKRIPLPCLDLYVNCFFVMKSCPNELFCYDHYLDTIQAIRPDLFAMLIDFWNKWISFDISLYDVANYTYKDFTAAFVHGLGQWTVRSIHTGNNKMVAA